MHASISLLRAPLRTLGGEQAAQDESTHYDDNDDDVQTELLGVQILNFALCQLCILRRL